MQYPAYALSFDNIDGDGYGVELDMRYNTLAHGGLSDSQVTAVETLLEAFCAYINEQPGFSGAKLVKVAEASSTLYPGA